MKIGDKVLIKSSKIKGVIVQIDDNNIFRINWNTFDYNGDWSYEREDFLELLKRELKDVEFGDMITDGEDFRYIFGRAGDAIFLSTSGRTEEKAKKADAMDSAYSLTEFLRDYEDWKFVEESDDVEVTANGKTTTISKKSAKALNLI